VRHPTPFSVEPHIWLVCSKAHDFDAGKPHTVTPYSRISIQPSRRHGELGIRTWITSSLHSLTIYTQGLITGRTSAFLLDPKRVDMQGSYHVLFPPSTELYVPLVIAKKRVVTVQSHEVAHM
jgi:hypothetical protein